MGRVWPVLLALAAAACAGPPVASAGAPERQRCFFASQVSGFSDAGPDRALVRIGFRETYELTLSPGCPEVNFALAIGIRARGGGRICTGRPAELVVPYPSGSGSRTCLVRSVRRLSQAEAAAARAETR